ncbi:hypothetical protein H7U34_01825 [Collinsella tanakaei]|nr:hypothetical protein [Collinsella tanakaei]
MLDLTNAFGELYQVKLFDGTVLNLKRPTQALQNAIIGLQKMGGSTKNIEKLMNETMSIFVRVLNRNNEGIEYTVDNIGADYDYSVALLVIGDYLKYYSQEITEKVNFQVVQ